MSIERGIGTLAPPLRIALILLVAGVSGEAMAASKAEWFDAVLRGDVEAARQMEGVDPDWKDADGRTALIIAAQDGNVALGRVLLERGATVDLREAPRGITTVPGRKTQYALEGRTPLAVAINAHRNEFARLLIERGADLRAKDVGDKSLLWGVCDVALVRKLLDAGLDPNQRGHTTGQLGGIPVMPYLTLTAYACPDAEIVHALLEGGANPNARGADGRTALSMAAQYHAPLKTFAYLLDAGADPNLRPRGELTPLMEAALRHESADVLQLLIDHGADVHAVDRQGKTALDWVRDPGANEKRAVLMKRAEATDPSR